MANKTESASYNWRLYKRLAHKLLRGVTAKAWVWQLLQGVVRSVLLFIAALSMSEKTEHNSVVDTKQDGAEKPTKKKSIGSKWEAVPIPVAGKPSVQPNEQRSYLDNSMDTASHAIKGKDQKENWQRIQRTTFTNWINNRLQGGSYACRLYTN